MENSNQLEAPQTMPVKPNNIVLGTFQSEEAMKVFYLQMSDTMNVNIHTKEHPDRMRLKLLHAKLKKHIDVLQHLSQHEWGQSVAEIQNACGVYLLQNNIDRKILLQSNREIGRHLQFIIQLAGNMSFIKQIMGNLNYHFQNVDYIIKKMEEPVEKPEV